MFLRRHDTDIDPGNDVRTVRRILTAVTGSDDDGASLVRRHNVVHPVVITNREPHGFVMTDECRSFVRDPELHPTDLRLNAGESTTLQQRHVSN